MLQIHVIDDAMYVHSLILRHYSQLLKSWEYCLGIKLVYNMYVQVHVYHFQLWSFQSVVALYPSCRLL